MSERCVETQIAIDKRSRGARLEASERELLTSHLPTCEICRAFAQTLTDTEVVMQAQAETLNKELDFSSLTEQARAAARKQKRGMIRGLIGLAALVALCVGLFIATGDPEILLPALAFLGLGAFFLIGDLARLRLTERWGNEAPPLEPSKAKRQRLHAVGKLCAFAALLAMPIPFAGAVAVALSAILELVALVGILHQLFVIRARTREIRALRD